MSRPEPIRAPAVTDIPPRRTRSVESIKLSLATVTPVLGGAYRTRSIDDVDVVRAPSIRGHLRFWWRALHAHNYDTAAALYAAETERFGGLGGGEQPGAARSAVDVAVRVTHAGSLDGTDVHPQHTQGAYALFPARRQGNADPVRRRNGVAFDLTVGCPTSLKGELRASLGAWILFGGYGARTRRGLGTLTVVGAQAREWLPNTVGGLRAALTPLLGRDVFGNRQGPTPVPVLAGATLSTIGVEGDAVPAWLAALDRLRAFRQAPGPVTPGHASPHARWPGRPPEPGRPSISNWPEADKIRHLAAIGAHAWPFDHGPRFTSAPVWPRAGFGLPIVGRFQTHPRGGGRPYREPAPFTLLWRDSSCEPPELRDRMASPLIVKAMPLANGRFIGIALWLHRSWPPGEVVLELDDAVVPGSGAPFDRLTAAGETPLFAPLVGKRSLREAFFDWLALDPGVRRVAP